MNNTSETQSTTNQLIKKIKKLEKENQSLKLTYAKCRDCVHANKYVPDYAYPYIIPKCELNIKKIDYDTNACIEFQMMGRNSR